MAGGAVDRLARLAAALARRDAVRLARLAAHEAERTAAEAATRALLESPPDLQSLYAPRLRTLTATLAGLDAALTTGRAQALLDARRRDALARRLLIARRVEDRAREAARLAEWVGARVRKPDASSDD